ncbi:MAG: choice-of-anchor I family protein [Bacteroides sp.]
MAGLFAVMLAAISVPADAVFAAEPEHIIINQIYGGGGKGDTPFSHSFIELYNPTHSAIQLDSYKITYSSNRENSKGKHAGSTWKADNTAEVIELNLSGSIPAGHSFLIRCAAEESSAAVVKLTDADLNWDRVIDNDKSVEIILYKDSQRIDAVSTRATDFRDVGEGNAPASDDISKQKSLRRTNFSDTDNNAADFSIISWKDDLPADEAQKKSFIDTYRPHSLADGAWSTNLPDSGNTPDAPEQPQQPAQDFTLKTDGFENANAVTLNKIGSYITGVSNKDGGVAEIVSYDSKNNKAWVVNGATGLLDILNLSDVTCAVSDKITAKSLDIKAITNAADPKFSYGDMTSVSVNSELGIVAVALQNEAYDKDGRVAILNTDGELLALINAGNQPDMLCFTPDGSKILVANEGEPRGGISEEITDPAGSVTIITINKENIKNSQSYTIGFEAFDSRKNELLADGIIFRSGALPSSDFEPEYIACSDDTAYVALQEANAIAVLDINTKTFTGVYSLGFKDLSLEKNSIDLVNDGIYAPKTYKDAVAAYMPDGISIYTTGGETYLLTANEGDAREWGSGSAEYANETKVTLTASDGTEAKKVRVIDSSVSEGLPAGKNVLFGGRSFSIYKIGNEGLTQVYDSANDFEKKTASYIPLYFNCSNDDNDYDSRSLKKGPEPESVTVGTVDGKTYAFIALERIGGIMMYDITNPANVTYTNYINSRDFAEDPSKASPDKNSGFSLNSDVAPEGLYFINSDASPSSTPILLAAFEVSGTVAAYSVSNAPSGHNWNGNTCTICHAVKDSNPSSLPADETSESGNTANNNIVTGSNGETIIYIDGVQDTSLNQAFSDASGFALSIPAGTILNNTNMEKIENKYVYLNIQPLTASADTWMTQQLQINGLNADKTISLDISLKTKAGEIAEPDRNVLILIPYPEGTNAATKFNVAHRKITGEIEFPETLNTENGIAVSASGLSPFIIGWSQETVKETPVETVQETAAGTEQKTETELTQSGAEVTPQNNSSDQMVSAQTSDNSNAEYPAIMLIVAFVLFTALSLSDDSRINTKR